MSPKKLRYRKYKSFDKKRLLKDILNHISVQTYLKKQITQNGKIIFSGC